MNIAKRNIGIFAVICQYDEASLMIGSKCLIGPAVRIELYLCLSSLKIQSIEHVVGNAADRGHEYELELIAREKKCTAKLKQNYCRLMRISYIFIKHSN